MSCACNFPLASNAAQSWRSFALPACIFTGARSCGFRQHIVSHPGKGTSRSSQRSMWIKLLCHTA